MYRRAGQSKPTLLEPSFQLSEYSGNFATVQNAFNLAIAPGFNDLAHRVMLRCDSLAQCTETDGMITRTFCSGAMASAHHELKDWMNKAGLNVRMDAACNLIGSTSTDDTRPRLLIGSHIDTVPNGGKYDGALGIVIGIALIEALSERVAQLPFAIEVIAFSEEEGVRFRSPYIGSRALAGCFDPTLLERTDDRGISLKDVVKTFGGNPDQLTAMGEARGALLAFIEPHIEQGPVLESEGQALGVVTGIAGQTRVTARFVGRASHAGTTPMNLRSDALAAAASWISIVESLAKSRPGLLATVGHLLVSPNVPNVIPGEVAVRLDARHMDDRQRALAVADLRNAAEGLAVQRGLEFFWERVEDQPAIPTDERLSDLLADAMDELSMPVRRLQSGAGHDAVIMSQIAPTAMLFLRSPGGISHHPEESVSQSDVEQSLRVLFNFVQKLSIS